MQKLKKKFIRSRTFVPLGKRVWSHELTGEKVFLPIGRFGVILLIGRSRSGKSSIAKTITAFVSNSGRRCLVFDPYSEYTVCLQPNMKSDDNIMGFKDFIIVKNFAFKIDEFWQQDWMSLGFSVDASRVLEVIGSKTELHDNDFDEFEKICLAVPSRDKQWSNFNKLYPEVLNSPIHAQTATQIKSKISWFRGFFKQEGDKKLWIPHFGKLLMQTNLIVDLGLRKGSDIEKARAYVGIILRQIEPYLRYLRLFMVFDEADLFAPFPQQNAVYSSACNKLIDYTIKMQREDLVVLYITQDYSLMHPILVQNWHWKILGILDPMSRDYELVKWLKNDFESTPYAHREFVLLSSNNRHYTFVPDIPPCRI